MFLKKINNLYPISSHRLSLFHQTRQHIQLSFVFSTTTLLPSPHPQTYLQSYQTVPCTLSLSCSTPPLKLHPRDPVSVYQFLATYQHRSRHKHGSTRYNIGAYAAHFYSSLYRETGFLSRNRPRQPPLARLHTVVPPSGNVVVTVLLRENRFYRSSSNLSSPSLLVLDSPVPDFSRVPWPPAGYENNAATDFLGYDQGQPSYVDTSPLERIFLFRVLFHGMYVINWLSFFFFFFLLS